MSDIDKKNSIVERRVYVDACTSLQRMPSHHALMKVNRLLLALVCVLMTVILLAGFLLLPSNSFVNRYQKAVATETYAAEMNPVVSSEVNALKRQLVGLVSGSIEHKLNALEESIRVGTLSSSIGTIEDLKKDLKTLRAYTESLKKENKENSIISYEELMLEMSQLKRLIYLTIASCGLMLAAVAGIWFKNRHRLPYKQSKTADYLSRD